MEQRITRKNRKTGSTVTVMFDDFLCWVTICETHNNWCEHATKTAAIEWMSNPSVWCAGCAEVK